MSIDIVSIEGGLDSLDLQRIATYTKKLTDIGSSFNKMLAPNYLRDFIIGYDISSVMLAKAIEYEIKAKAALETAEAIAYLDKAPEYFKVKNEKPTVESRKAYVSLDSDVQRAKEVYARSVAMCSLLKNKVQEFKHAIEVTRDMSRDGYSTPYEGMRS
jgi:hypothetical protein